MTVRVSSLIALLVPLLAFGQHAPPARPFQPFDACIYKPQRWNDGDSFHVILPDRKEVIFRLYFVDAPEEERTYSDRIAEQAAYFGISPNAAAEVGHEASEFTRQALAKPFTIQTRWRLALGRSTLPRYYAIVLTAGRTRLERTACECGAGTNLRHANPAAGWLRFADIFGAPSRARNAGESGATWCVEQGAAVKYWEIIADDLSKAGWSWGCVATVGRDGGTIFVADAHRGDGERFVVHADEKLTAFLELERAICLRPID